MNQFWSVFVRAVYVLLKVPNKKAVDNPHIKMPVNPSTGPNSRHSFGSTKSQANRIFWKHRAEAAVGVRVLIAQ